MSGADTPEGGWRSGVGRVVRDDPAAEAPAPPRRGRHGRPGAPDSTPPGAGWPSASTTAPQHRVTGTGGHARPDPAGSYGQGGGYSAGGYPAGGYGPADTQGGYGPPSGYPGDYGQADGYAGLGQPGGPAQPGGYGQRPGPGDDYLSLTGYDLPTRYDQPGQPAGDYGQPQPGQPQPGQPQPGGFGTTGGHSPAGGYGQPGSQSQTGGFGSPLDGYGAAGGYSTGGQPAADGYAAGGHSPAGGFGQPGADGYAASWHSQAGGFGQPGGQPPSGGRSAGRFGAAGDRSESGGYGQPPADGHGPGTDPGQPGGGYGAAAGYQSGDYGTATGYPGDYLTSGGHGAASQGNPLAYGTVGSPAAAGHGSNGAYDGFGTPAPGRPANGADPVGYGRLPSAGSGSDQAGSYGPTANGYVPGAPGTGTAEAGFGPASGPVPATGTGSYGAPATTDRSGSYRPSDLYGPPDPYSQPSARPDQAGPADRTIPGRRGPEHTGPLQRSGPQDWTLRPDLTGPQNWSGDPAPSGPQDWTVAPDQSGPQDWPAAARRSGPQDWTVPADRSGPQDWTVRPDHTGPQQRASHQDYWDGQPRGAQSGQSGPQMPAFPPERPWPGDPRKSGEIPVGSGYAGPDADYDSRDSLTGVPAVAGPAGWESPADPPRRPRADDPPPWDPHHGTAADPDDAAPTTAMPAPSRRGARRPAAPRPEPAAAAEDQDSPDWAAEERHRGFFQGFGEDENVDPPKRRHGRWMAPLISLVVILGVIGAAGGFFIQKYSAAHANYTGSGTGSVIVTVKLGDTATSLGPRLLAKGVIKAIDPFVAAAKSSPESGDLKPGTFRLRKHMNAALAWALLLNPQAQIQTVVGIPDGWRATAILARLSQDTGIPLSQFTAALKDTAALGLPSYANGNPEGYLYPDTYTFQPHTSALQMLQTMVNQFKTETAPLNLPAVAAAGHLTVEQVIIEASLLEGEGGPAYFGQIARVIDNRLNQKMDLGLDSTIEYALNIDNIDPTQSQLNSSNPYNTLNHPGLPPGPIDSPDVTAITAALHPPQGNWIYFVTVDPKTGLTKFTNSFSQFSIWKAEFQKNLKDGT